MKQLLRLPAVILILSLTILSLAQNPDIPREWLEDRLQLEGDRITCCLNPDALTASFDRALAQELAGVLLLEPRIHEVETWRPTPPLDYRLPLNQNQTFMLLADHCNAFINFSISPHTPEWMILTRDRKSTRLNSSHVAISYAVFCLKKKKSKNASDKGKNGEKLARRIFSWQFVWWSRYS